MIELEFAELHGPIFIKGTNLPPKLIPGDAPGQRRDIKIFYDRGERELYVHFKDKVGIVPRENVAMMVEKVSKVPSQTPTEGAMALKDACVMGTGCLKVYVDEQTRKVCVDRVMISDLYVDDNDSLNGDPQQMVSHKMPEPVLKERGTAQVDSPMHHVFKGEGFGKTGRDK